jgi:hypothetical protein
MAKKFAKQTRLSYLCKDLAFGNSSKEENVPTTHNMIKKIK